ncbi:MAG: DivIVA domain-containing protein [Clostridia bacterium]|nr:DivIVA domain-containing protein [Clostridia bacterium]
MAITVRDIQEKEFFTQETGGYSIEQVDDFLDEIAEQMGVLIRENLELNEQLRQLDGDLEAAKKAAAEAEAKTPDYNEKDYFLNLQSAMRESLIGAQRIADETIEEANQKAVKLLSDAQAEADKISVESKAQAETLVANAQAKADRISANAKSEIEALEARIAALKASAKSFKADFTKLIEDQAAIIRDNAGLF